MQSPTSKDNETTLNVNTNMLTSKQAAEKLGIAPATLSNWRLEDPPRGPRFIRIGTKKILYPADEIERYLRDHIVITREYREGVAE